MNYFFKFLLPQLYDYFKDEAKVFDFIPQIIKQRYESTLLKYNENEREEDKNVTTTK